MAPKLVTVFANEQDRVLSDSADHHDINGTEIICATMKKAHSMPFAAKEWPLSCISSY